MARPTQLEQLKHRIEEGESCVYAFEQVDTKQMKSEGYPTTANNIKKCLALVDKIVSAADVDYSQ